ncbi:Transcription factor bHLH [Abeliophyllum distichum]|uniref:Transcription factor bHLH n=1 Tax=Abeliophyllum distichum TaxID=126358 RepID=A0ABD1VXI2_9LAMI
MFSLLQDDDFSPENPTFSITYSDFIIPQDLGIDHASLGSLQGTTLNIDDKKGKRMFKSYDKCPKDGLQKKIVHREVERQRRQEMAILYHSLRSVIPQEHVKIIFTRPANYIRNLQNNIEELENKRDKLKNFSNDQNSKTGSCSNTLPVNVRVKSCTVGIEVSITGDFLLEGFPLSRVMEILQEEGLNVISCICTKVEGTSHYTIQSEVMDFPGVNLDTLQRKLCYMIIHWINFV